MTKCPVCKKVEVCDCSVFDLMTNIVADAPYTLDKHKTKYGYGSPEDILRETIERADSDFDENSNYFGE